MPKTIYFTSLASPWGPMFLAGTEAAICSCQFIAVKDVSNLLDQVQKKHNDALLQENALPLASAVADLKRYFSGEQDNLSHPLDLQGSPFQMEVWSALREIPPGSVATYGEIAARIGRPGGGRAVGQSCGRNPVVLFVPCHRVVAANGGLGGFGSGLSVKEALLLHEGVRLK
ncbi:MAG: methylated-DNA--[protein]-cysteine S-methyltransferase [Deltaproteobacteria bacterium]|nr:MAG: methylated-DNA--[protein]-cysteine S-methyltransferase [Deltaproteobacteria bacterium]